MVERTVAGWFLIAILAVANGIFRQAKLVPKMGDQRAHVASTFILCALILLVTRALLPWIGPISLEEAWRIGIGWLLGTVAFEFVAGHYVFGNPWSKLLADYDLRKGRIWILVLVTMLVAPVLIRVAFPALR